MNSLVTDGTTFVNPIGLAFTILMGLLTIILPRRYALLPVIALICYMTMGMRIMIAGLNFTMMRILLLFGWARVIVRDEMRIGKLNAIDKALIAFTISSVIIYTLLWHTSAAFINRCGLGYNVIGMYFLFRFLIRGADDLVRALEIAALLILPLAASMVLESRTGRNIFAVFGGVPPITMIRDGVLRCQGPFAHPILAGTFGATVFPLFVGLWRRGNLDRVLSILAVISCGAITFTAGSSGPVLAFLAGLVALALWPLRRYITPIRQGILLTLVGLEIVMKAHIWYLMGRANIFEASTGYHRAYLVDRAFANLGDWWLMGTKSTAAWASPEAHLFDVTNQYLVNGADGGVITMLLFILVIVLCFRAVGLTVRALGKRSRNLQLLVWTLGASLFSHAVTFLSVSYFDQNFVNWYLLLAMISTAWLSVGRDRYARGIRPFFSPRGSGKHIGPRAGTRPPRTFFPRPAMSRLWAPTHGR